MAEGGIALFGNVGIEGDVVRINKNNNGVWWEVGSDIADVNGDYRIPPVDWASLGESEPKADTYKIYVNDIFFEEKFIDDGDWAEQP